MFAFRHYDLDISLTFSANLDCISLMRGAELEDQEDGGHEERGRHHLSQGPYSGAVSPPVLVRSLFGKDVMVSVWYEKLW